jgi:hypothetical protein
MAQSDKLDQFADPMDMWQLLAQLKSRLDTNGSITVEDWNWAVTVTGTAAPKSSFDWEPI